ncbi:unnamed protein product [Blepharisma stoltei]|uniref:Uncharacterized protein n=1 Tax=Blepharisma stoltei TaxID=1481888 RepID=A0AAU9K722_9CILI|nr:unnamed protein product [Blepharisma stoltei]
MTSELQKTLELREQELLNAYRELEKVRKKYKNLKAEVKGNKQPENLDNFVNKIIDAIHTKFEPSPRKIQKREESSDIEEGEIKQNQMNNNEKIKSLFEPDKNDRQTKQNKPKNPQQNAYGNNNTKPQFGKQLANKQMQERNSPQINQKPYQYPNDFANSFKQQADRNKIANKPAYNEPYLIHNYPKPQIQEPMLLPNFPSYSPQSFPKQPAMSQPILQDLFNSIKNSYWPTQAFDVSILSIDFSFFKKFDTALICNSLLEELKKCLEIFSFNDAYYIINIIIKGLLGEETRDKQFFGNLKKIIISPTAKGFNFASEICKIQPIRYTNQWKSLQELLHVCYISICKEYGYFLLIRSLASKQLKVKEIRLFRLIFEIWESDLGESQLFSLKTYKKLYENIEDTESLFKDIALEAARCTEDTHKDLYVTAKSLISFVGGKTAYKYYENYLWQTLSSAFKDSLTRVIILEMIGPIITQLSKNSDCATVTEGLQRSMEEILTDENFESFSFKEQKAAAKTLEKCGYTSPISLKWRTKFIKP